VSTHRVAVTGLDGSTPLGFLAALGLLRILDELKQGSEPPRLSWRVEGRWVPMVHGVDSNTSVMSAVSADVASWGQSAVLRFRYVKVGKKTLPFAGLTPPVAVLRGWLTERLEQGDYGAIEYACALMTETATQPLEDDASAPAETLERFGIRLDAQATLDRACMQSPFDFSSRNMQFLDQIDTIRRRIVENPAWVDQALTSGDAVEDDVRSMGWDTSAKAPGAQYPIRRNRRYPVAEWLAFRGLALLPIFGVRDKVHATGCHGQRLAGKFVWPVWVPPATLVTVRSLMACPDLEREKVAKLRALGVAQVFRAGLTKLGKYDAIFSPTEPVGGALMAGLAK
jgi:hypothetical protein